MSDNGSEASEEHAAHWIAPANDVLPAPRDEVVDPVLGIPIKDLRLVDSYFHELAMEAALDPRPNTPAEQAIDDELLVRARERMTMSPDEVRALRRRW